MKPKNKLKTLYFGLTAFLATVLFLLSYLRVFDDFECSTLDFRYALRPPLTVSKDIVIIEIGDDSIEKLGKWPFPRNYHALMIKALKKAGVRDIVFDIFFSEEKEGDADLAEAAKDAGNVYMPYVFDIERSKGSKDRVKAARYAAPLIDIFSGAVKGKGFINVEPDQDGKVRHIPPVIYYEDKFYPHMTVLVALNQLGYDFDKVKIIPGKRIEAGKDLVIPMEDNSSMMVNYPAKWGKAFRHYSYVDVLQSYLASMTGQEATIDLNELKGATCFIGLTATASPDAHPSPMEPLYAGIGVHTSVYDSIMSKTFLVRLNRWWNILILAIVALLTAFITLKVRKRFAMFSIVLIMAAYVGLSMIFFWPFGIWVDVFYPLVAVVAIYVALTFKKYVSETQRREGLEKELNIAKDIQLSFLPREIPSVGGIEVAAKMYTAKQVGGDLYDILELDDKRMGLMIGDVSGKGVPAALYMARVVSIFKSFARHGAPAKVIRDMNERIVEEGGSSLFVTLTYAIFDTGSGRVTFSMGGHLPTIAVSPDRSVKALDTEDGPPVGLIEGDFSEHSYDYEPGTIFIFYTDGVTEAMNPKEEMFGHERLIKLAARLNKCSSSEVVDAVYKAVTDFAGKAPQHDDITIIAVKT